MTFTVGAVNESGILPKLCAWATDYLDNAYLIGSLSGILAAVFNNLTVMLSDIAAFSTNASISEYAPDGTFWPLLSYSTAIGGTLLVAGTMAGFAFWRMEEVSLKWYLRHFVPKVMAGFAVGLLVFWIVA